MLRIPLTIATDPDLPEAASPFVAIMVDGEPASALLDTGAATSAVVERPGLATHTVTPRGTGLFGIERAEELRADVRISLSDRDLGVVDVQVVPTHHPGHGNLVGQDILGRWCCEYRLGEGELVVDLPPLNAGTPITVGPRAHAIIDVEFPGDVRARGLFDTGASLTVVDAGFATAHPDLFAPGEMTSGIDADGNTADTPLLRMAALEMLGSTFPESVAVAVDLQPIQRPDAGFDLILGWPVLRHGRFTIDTARHLARHTR